jgi:hypothetical protein
MLRRWFWEEKFTVVVMMTTTSPVSLIFLIIASEYSASFELVMTNG